MHNINYLLKTSFTDELNIYISVFVVSFVSYIISKRMAANWVFGCQGGTAQHDEDKNEVGENVMVD